MSSTMNFQHGDLPRTHLDFLDPAGLTPFTFDGNGTQRDAITAKDKMINALRRRGLEEFITKPHIDLLPDEADYNIRDAKERRELAKDKNEVTEKHRKAYATVRAIIKPNSACEAIINEADYNTRDTRFKAITFRKALLFCDVSLADIGEFP